MIEIKVPNVGESVSEVEVGEWLKAEGAPVAKDENLVVLETDKATMEVPAPETGRLAKILKRKGERVAVGDVLAQVEPGNFAEAKAKPAEAKKGESKPAEAEKAAVMPAAARLMAEKNVAAEEVKGTGPGGRILKEDVQRAIDKPPATAPAPPPSAAAPAPPAPARPAAAEAERPPAAQAAESIPPAGLAGRSEEAVPMSLLRRKIAERLVAAQQNAALLTTFNEIDMFAVMTLRKEHQERFQQLHGVKLGIMSFFVKAVVEALKENPALNAEIRGTNIVYRNYYDIGVAIGGGRGLVVPVLRNVERLSFAEVEVAIAAFAQKVKDNKLRPEDLEGGTFTVTNGGVYGSLLSTPLINPPQSGVLGMHAIKDRPAVVDGQVVVRPMMYVALTYDHRVVDGREAVTFLRRVKELVESPVRMLIEF